MDEDELDALIEKTKQYSGKDSLSPDEYYRIKQLLNDPDQLNRISTSSVSYLILGNYDDEGDFSKKDRLKLVRLSLNERDPGAYAFLMEEIDEAWGNEFITKFRILSDRVDYIVGVFEDDAGGHANESGIVVTELYRSRTFVLKREYETKEEERAAYNAMQANIFAILDRTGGLALWTDRFELVEEAKNLPTEPAE
ncbi:hypothetical protein [Haladaptatus sp. CMAA 1911]|uniref:hypothetical protein n=1 Tax=unclassified Haladaptatus TaxID=2622732 RepID=UPI0037542054